MARRALGQLPVVLSDIRFDVDKLLENCGEDSLTVIALESALNHDADLAETIEIERLGRTFTFRVANSQTLVDWVSSCGQTESLLLTNFDSAFLPNLRGMHRDADACSVSLNNRILAGHRTSGEGFAGAMAAPLGQTPWSAGPALSGEGSPIIG